MGETTEEQVERVKLMASGDPTWDLSDNDIAALKGVLKMLDDACAWIAELELKAGVTGHGRG